MCTAQKIRELSTRFHSCFLPWPWSWVFISIHGFTGFLSEQNVFLPTMKKLFSQKLNETLTAGADGDRQIHPSFISISTFPPRKV